MIKITAVMASEIKNGFTYWAESEGGIIPLRKKATRLYANAFYYGDQKVTGGSSGLAGHFLYGKKAPSYLPTPVKTFKVILMVEKPDTPTNLTELAAYGL